MTEAPSGAQVREMILDHTDPQFQAVVDSIGDETLKTIFHEDVTAINRLKTAIGEVEQLMTDMSGKSDCFDREDVENAARMRRVLASELDWRKRRLAIAVREYDEKIVKLIQVMEQRQKVLQEHEGLGKDSLLNPLESFFEQKQRMLENYSKQLKERMRELLVRPLVNNKADEDYGPEQDRDWRTKVKETLTSQQTKQAYRAFG